MDIDTPTAHRKNHRLQFDTLLVFGEGPVKAVLLVNETTPTQHKEWIEFLENPTHFEEPDFHIIQDSKYLSHLKGKSKTIQESIRIQWQSRGWLGLRKWGRENALAAGFALYKGITKKVVLSGGKTIAPWVQEVLPQKRLSVWPSEAELMADIIKTYYGSLYEKKWGKNIEDAVYLESQATNTIENFVYSINTYPELLLKKRIGYISTKHHLKRITRIAELFSLASKGNQLCAQELLPTIQRKKTFSTSLGVHQKREERWIQGLTNPDYVTYWLGYLGEVKNPSLLQRSLHNFGDPWKSAIKNTLKNFKIELEEYLSYDFVVLAKENPEKYTFFTQALSRLKEEQYRVMPPLVE